MKYKDIDLGFNHIMETPLSERKSISILLGAGFSAPKGYPIGNEMNENLLNFDHKNVFFHHQEICLFVQMYMKLSIKKITYGISTRNILCFVSA